jgi:hypothetical protein
MHPITDSLKDTVNGMMLCVLIILLILTAVICVILN